MKVRLPQFYRTVLLLGAASSMHFFQIGCSKPADPASTTPPSAQKQVSTATTEPEITARIRKEVAGILKKKESEIDVATPLGSQGADELDLVEIVMATEEAFAIEIPDEALNDKISEAGKTFTIQKLAAIVAANKKTK